MPVSLETPVLTVDANVIHKIDTGNPQNLFSMWTVFSKCVDSVEQGRRLENLSWRLWTRETFCVEEATQAAFATTQPQDIPVSRIPDCPQLSGSVDSIVDEEEAVELNNEADPLEIRPAIIRQDSCASTRSRGRERHITSGHLEKMVVGIIKHKEPLTAPLPSIPTPVLVVEAEAPKPTLERTGSTTTEATDKTSDEQSGDSQPGSSPETSSSMKSTNIVRGFSPSAAPMHRTISPTAPHTSHMIPEPTAAPAPKAVQAKKGGRFDIGPSSSPDSYSDSAASPQPTKSIIAQQKKSTFMVGAASSESSGNNSVPHNMLAPPKKHAAFSTKVSSRSIQESSAVADDSESDGEYIDESAIDDDDDSSDWEELEESGKSSFDDKNIFQRVDSKANLTSRRSLITLMIEQNERRTGRLGNHASQSTSALSHPRTRTSHPVAAAAAPAVVSSPNDSDDAPLTMKRAIRGTPLKPINEVSRTAAQPIMTNNHAHQQAALSPRTTRRNMLATELTESLRRHLLWERQQKSSTANAVLKRRHTSHDVANLKQYPERPYLNKAEDANASSWNEYWTKEAFTGYHTQGW